MNVWNSPLNYAPTYRKLDELGDAVKTISQAKAAIIENFHDACLHFGMLKEAAINACDLKPSGIWCMRELVRRGLARDMSEVEDSIAWCVTRDPWVGEFLHRCRR